MNHRPLASVVVSSLLLAAAPSDVTAQAATAAVRPASAASVVDSFTIASTALHDTLTVVVRLPAGHANDRRHPVVYTLQPGVYFRRLDLPAWLDSTEASGAAPVIAVAIPDADTLAAYRPDTPEGEAYVRFIAEELVPAVEARHATRAEPAGRLLLGFSAGANVLLDVAVRNPALFGRMAAVSPGWMFRSDDGGIGVQFDSSAVTNIRRAPSAPVTNVWFVWGDGPSEWERRSRVLGAGVIAALRARGVTVRDAGLVPGDHDLDLARKTLAGAMGHLLAP